MPDVREKLVELLRSVPRREEVSIGRGCGKSFARLGIIADHLIANGVTIQRWIPVEEMTPEPYERVIVRDFYGVIAVGHILGEQWVVSWTNDCLPFVTHWMPLPDAPKGDD